MSQQLKERYSQSAQDPDSSLPLLDPLAINPAGLEDSELPDPTAIVGRTRRPQVKLTAEKLCSPKGLPKLMKEGPKRIRISKRKSSYDNLTHLLQYYQLWAHELFPKAKFHDFAALCRTLGKSDKDLREYRIELLRQEFAIPSFGEQDLEAHDEESGVPAQPSTDEQGFTQRIPPSEPPSPSRSSLFVADTAPTFSTTASLHEDDDNDGMIYDRSQNAIAAQVNETSSRGNISGPTNVSPGGSEFTQESVSVGTSGPGKDKHGADEDEDEMALMREFGM
ncbi:LADA_0D09494g1_1 [Lachancea dasiensis]|uniref:Chromosome segregation in meiosis protein n=1 Tax=Lachancea dasiensis TaxID=1072105 RepID=A0A1G4J7H3_9SACH|nr:LADA_0D09494g1_1 [Lachancea dasiensis]